MSNPGPLAPSSGPLTRLAPLGPDEVELRDGVLGHWQRRTASATMPHGIRMLESEGALDNVRRLIGRSTAPFRGMVFQDSDIHKTLEAVAWQLGREDDLALREFFDATVELLEAAQRDDGYLDSAFQRDDAPSPVWTDFASGHELYCAGHLIQAAVAARRALGDERLFAVATRLADHIVDRFGTAGAPGEADYPGHPEIEYALVELYRTTGDRRYLDTAAAFVERRGAGRLGRGAFGSSYFQDDAPVRESAILRGHAVRALYLNAGATDVAIETGDDELLAAMLIQWDDLVSHRLYVTGGTGSRHRDEAFGDAFELPPDRSYAETCAGIALVHWAWRMLVATGEARFADAAETALYNVVAAGVGERGTTFFYSNPLQLRADHIAGQEEATASRLPWYACACCPPNLMRTFATTESLLALAGDGELALAGYGSARIATSVASTSSASGSPVVLEVETGYPHDGAVRIRVLGGDGSAAIALRIPGWCRDWNVRVDGEARPVEAVDGWARLPGALAAGAVVELELAMPAVVLAPHPRIDAVRGAVAVRRGPIVYCLEQRDNGVDVESCAIHPAAAIAPAPGDAGVLGPLLVARGVARGGDADAPLYREWAEDSAAAGEPVELVLRPYAEWGNGEPGAMRVWIPTVR